MKKVYILLLSLLLLTSCFSNNNQVVNTIDEKTTVINNQNEIKDLNQQDSGLLEEDADKLTENKVEEKIIEKPQQKVEELSELDKCLMNGDMGNLSVVYKEIKSNYTDKDTLENLGKELKIVEGFATKKCSVITDDYAKKLCEIYVNGGDYQGLNTFDFTDGENKDEYVLFFDSLKEGKVLKGAKEKNVNQILDFQKAGKNIEFDFRDELSTYMSSHYSYYAINGKDKFFKELDSQFLDECKKIINE